MIFSYKTFRQGTACGFAALALAAIAGCGKQPIPDPPRSRSRLTIEIFKDLELNRHEPAAEKIVKLKAVDPENVFLAELEENEVCNIYMDTIQRQLNAGDIDAAIKTVEQARRKHGLYRGLIQVEVELKKLKELQEAVNNMRQAEQSEPLFAEIERVRQIISDYPPAQILGPMLNQKAAAAAALARQENLRARFSLLCDLVAMRQYRRHWAETMAAELEFENRLPENKNSRLPENLLPAAQ